MIIFGCLVCLSAGLAILFRQKNNAWAYAIFKPLTTILIIFQAIILTPDNHSPFSNAIIVGLVFSLVGDVFLLKDKLFTYGLFAFLVAHILFTYAFSSLYGFEMNFFLLAVLLMIGFTYFRFLQPHLKSFTIPVLVYFVAIIVMDWQAIGLSFSQDKGVFYFLGLSSILFSFSDAVIAYKKFIKDFKFAEVFILSTYWMAIFIMSASIAFVQSI